MERLPARPTMAQVIHRAKQAGWVYNPRMLYFHRPDSNVIIVIQRLPGGERYVPAVAAHYARRLGIEIEPN